MKSILKAVFRTNKYGETEMFYYDEDKNLVCFCLFEGHSYADYKYYLSCNSIKTINDDVKRIINYYEGDEDIKIEFKQKLKR